jgi:ABC-type branched-subunit amino acid transport system ATPase component
MILEVDKIIAGYGCLQILQGVSFGMSAGEIVGVIGPNGAGKSTLVKTVFGYLRPFEGKIRFKGSAITGQPPERIIRLGMAYVAQAGGVFADMTVKENIAMGGYSLRDRHAVASGAERAYRQFPFLRSRTGQRAGSLSGGEQRKLAIARSLVVQPSLLILDEPSAALAPKAIDETYDCLLDLNKKGISLLIVEQNVQKILEIAHRIVILEIGRTVFEGTADELRASDRIRKLYLGER